MPETDHFEHRTIGPPGCGKTTWLASQVRKACEANRNPMIVSLTRAAANEVVGRDLPVARHQVGTLHSQCHYALNRPAIAEDKNNLKSWNEEYGHYKLTPSEGANRNEAENDLMETPGSNIGDDVMNQYQILRAKMIPREQYPKTVADFAQRWEDWKKQSGLMDFTDLIENALNEVDQAPGAPDVIFIDEGQDMNVLEMSLARKWGKASGYLIVVGDPDQNIYSWRGSDPSVFLYPEIPESNWRTLCQSYRVPKAVHHRAVPWITQSTNRRPVDYYPTDQEGQVRELKSTWEQTDAVIEDMKQYLDAEKSIMLIASCSYMLRDLLLKLRLAGIPFHNPQRVNNGAWNPLQRREGHTSATDRLLAFLKIAETGDLWNADEARRFCDALKLTNIVQSTKRQELLDNLQNEDPTGADGATLSWEQIYKIFSSEAIEAAMTGDLNWYIEHAKSASQGPLRFPAEIIEKRGADQLRSEPQTIVGTIHSTKGGEADVVYLFPDLSQAGMKEYQGNSQQRNTVYRLFYVGMTRARQDLIICKPGNGTNYVQII